MSEELNQDQDLAQDELTSLKARADRMGISYHPSIGLEKLRAKVQAAMNDEPQTTDDKGDEDKTESAPAAPVETEAQRRKRRQMEAQRLVRIRLTCMNPAKKDWDGEIITVGNSTVGTIKKFVPFNAEEGWHVPHFIYEVLKARQCQIFVPVKTKNGVTVRQGKLIKEFAIEVLDPLTPAELRDLAQRQAMAAGE